MRDSELFEGDIVGNFSVKLWGIIFAERRRLCRFVRKLLFQEMANIWEILNRTRYKIRRNFFESS